MSGGNSSSSSKKSAATKSKTPSGGGNGGGGSGGGGNEIRDMSQILCNLCVRKNFTVESLERLRAEEKERFEEVKKVTSKLLPTYARDKKIRNIFKAQEKTGGGGIVVESILNLYDIRILQEKEGDLAEVKELVKFHKTEEEKGMLHDAFRYLLFHESRVDTVSIDFSEDALVKRAFIMDRDRKRSYPLGGKEAKEFMGQTIVFRPVGKSKVQFSLEAVASLIENYYGELSLLLNKSLPPSTEVKRTYAASSASSSDSSSASTSDSSSSSSSSSSEEEEEKKKKKKKKKSGKSHHHHHHHHHKKDKKEKKKKDHKKGKKEEKSSKSSSKRAVAPESPDLNRSAQKRVKLTESSKVAEVVTPVEESSSSSSGDDMIVEKVIEIVNEPTHLMEVETPSSTTAASQKQQQSKKNTKKGILEEAEDNWEWWAKLMIENGKM